MANLVLGVGINDGTRHVWVKGKHLKSYTLWVSLLNRCYSLSFQKGNPTYVGCSASENFRNFSYFHEWCLTQIGFGQLGFQLDKDLLLKGNKVYSENTCLFLPKDLNILLKPCKTAKGHLPIGVSTHGGKFKASCVGNFPSRHVGIFGTPEEAFQAYKRVKETYIKTQAEKWKAHIDPRAFATLMAYTVQIAD